MTEEPLSNESTFWGHWQQTRVESKVATAVSESCQESLKVLQNPNRISAKTGRYFKFQLEVLIIKYRKFLKRICEKWTRILKETFEESYKVLQNPNRISVETVRHFKFQLAVFDHSGIIKSPKFLKRIFKESPEI